MSMEGSVATRAAEQAAENARRVAEAAAKPSEVQVRAARDASHFFGEEIDPLTVVEHGHRSPYEHVSVKAHGIRLIGDYLWGGGDDRYRQAGTWTAERRVLGIFRRQRSPVHNLGDVAGWVR